MTKNIFFLLLALAGLFTISSCYKDLGNYTYTDLNEIEGGRMNGITGIDTVYDILVGDSLNIYPKFKWTNDKSAGADTSSRYTYKWVALNSTSTSTDSVSSRILGTTRNLNIVASSNIMSNFKVYFRITDKETGIETESAPFKLYVSTTIKEGYLVLSDVNGVSRLGMLSYYQQSFHPFTDILAKVGSTVPMQGKPYMVACYNYRVSSPVSFDTSYGISILSEAGTNRIHSGTFQYTPKLNIKYEMVGSIPDGFKFNFLQSGSLSFTVWGITAEGNVHRHAGIFNRMNEVPVNFINAEGSYAKVAPISVFSSDTALFYDVNKKRILMHKASSINMTVLPNPTTNRFFRYDSIGMDLVTMEHVYTHKVYSLFKDNSSNLWLAKFAMKGTQDRFVKLTTTAAPEIDKAEKFTFSPTSEFLFYSVGGKVYKYEIATNKAYVVINDTKPVTFLKFYKFNLMGTVNTYITWKNLLMVGTYDPAAPVDNSATLSFYTVPATPASSLGLYGSYPGFSGKIVSVAYRERL